MANLPGLAWSAIVCLSSAPLHFPMLRSQCLLTAPLPSRVLLWRRSPWPSLPRCCGACSTPFSRLLQPSVRSVEDLGVLASSHRPLPSQSLCGRVSLSDGDHSVCSPLGTSGGLDGLHRSQGSVSAGASPSCFSSSSALRLQRQGLSVQSSLLWPLHGSAGLHQGHGSCFRHSPFYGDPHEVLPRRLARPVILSRIPRPGFADGSPPLSRVGDCRQSSKVQPRSIPGCPISRSHHRRPIFQGFSIARTRLQASVNSRRISVLRLASRELMALAAGRPFFAGSPSSWRPFANAISSFASTGLGIVWISRLRCRCLRNVSATSSGGSTFLACPQGCLSARCLPTFTFGQTPRTWGEVPI